MEEDVVGVVVVRVVMGGFDGGYGMTQLKDQLLQLCSEHPAGFCNQNSPKFIKRPVINRFQ